MNDFVCGISTLSWICQIAVDWVAQVILADAVTNQAPDQQEFVPQWPSDNDSVNYVHRRGQCGTNSQGRPRASRALNIPRPPSGVAKTGYASRNRVID